MVFLFCSDEFEELKKTLLKLCQGGTPLQKEMTAEDIAHVMHYINTIQQIYASRRYDYHGKTTYRGMVANGYTGQKLTSCMALYYLWDEVFNRDLCISEIEFLYQRLYVELPKDERFHRGVQSLSSSFRGPWVDPSELLNLPQRPDMETPPPLPRLRHAAHVDLSVSPPVKKTGRKEPPVKRKQAPTGP
jgi:hypothetical protein